MLQRSLREWRVPFVALLVSTFVIAWQATSYDARISSLEESVARLEAAAAEAAGAPDAAIIAFNEFGFTLPLPDGVEVQSSGLAGGQAGREEGQLSAAVGGVGMALTWTKLTIPLKDAVQRALQVLVAAQPALKYEALNAGDMKVDTRPGSFEAFGVYDDNQTLMAIGVIGAWSCGTSTFAMTVVGEDPAAVESSYEGLTDGFKCP